MENFLQNRKKQMLLSVHEKGHKQILKNYLLISLLPI